MQISNPITRQQLFDLAVAHMDKQRDVSVLYYDGEENEKLAGIIDTCLYRSDDGKKCIVGAMIDDKHYQPALERQSASQGEIIHVMGLSGYNVTEDDKEFLNDLQSVHDKWADDIYNYKEKDLQKLKDRFIHLAYEYELNPETAVISFS